nr:hypothetical protein [Pedobacter sp. ASV2]
MLIPMVGMMMWLEITPMPRVIKLNDLKQFFIKAKATQTSTDL